MAEIETVEQEDVEEGRTIENPNIQALMQINEAEVNRQIITARAYPRSLTDFRRQMREMVTFDEETARGCLYAYKRGGKQIEGPSINFAASAMQCWGNCRTGSRITDIGEDFVTAQGFFWDMEKNMAVAFEVLRRITTSEKNGDKTRYTDDMIMTTGNAAGSIALRNAILKGIPKTAWNGSYQAARRAAVGDAELFSTKREEMVKAFALMGVDVQQICGLLGVKGIDDVNYDSLIFLAGVYASIKDGEQKVDEVFAISNMSHPDQVRPGGGKRDSAFERKQPMTGGQAQEAAEKVAADKPAERAADPAKDEKAATVQANLDQERKQFVRDAYDRLAETTKVRDIPALQDRILNAGVMTEAEEKTWVSECEARAAEIMKAAKASSKK